MALRLAADDDAWRLKQFLPGVEFGAKKHDGVNRSILPDLPKATAKETLAISSMLYSWDADDSNERVIKSLIVATAAKLTEPVSVPAEVVDNVREMLERILATFDEKIIALVVSGSLSNEHLDQV